MKLTTINLLTSLKLRNKGQRSRRSIFALLVICYSVNAGEIQSKEQQGISEDLLSKSLDGSVNSVPVACCEQKSDNIVRVIIEDNETVPRYKRIMGKEILCANKVKTYDMDSIYPPKSWIIQKKWLKIWVEDFFKIQGQLFTWDSAKVLSVIVPTYLGTRFMDKELHNCFYDWNNHKNIHQLPKALCELSDKGIVAMMAVLASFSFFSNNKELRLTSYVYTQATIAYWVAKNIFKDTSRSDCNKRPKHEKFCKDCTAYGGFPSGHAGEATMAAILFGLRHGPKWGVPLGIYAALVFGVSVSSNRHFVSQVVGGVGLGMLYGFAAYNLIKCKFPYDISCGLASDDKGRSMVNASYSF